MPSPSVSTLLTESDAALLVEATDDQGLAAALERVITDETLRKELIARGRDRLGDFSWQETARALASCYRKLAERGT